MSTATSATHVYEVVPRFERIGGRDQIVDWELWADRERTAYGWQGEFIDGYRTEQAANAARGWHVDREAVALRDRTLVMPGDLVLPPLGRPEKEYADELLWRVGLGYSMDHAAGSVFAFHYREEKPGKQWLVGESRRDLEGRAWSWTAVCVVDDFGTLVEVPRA